jgi:HEAT repeat protein
VSTLIVMIGATTVWSAPAATAPAAQASATQAVTTQAATSQPTTQPPLTELEENYLVDLEKGTGGGDVLLPKVQTLLSFRKPEALSRLAGLLAGSNVPATRIAICQAIALPDSGPARLSPAFIEPLLAMLSLNEDPLRHAAVMTLPHFHGLGVSARLGKMAGDTNVAMETRRAALETLKGISHETAIDALITLVDNPTPEIKSATASILAEATDQPVGRDWEKWWKDNRGSWAHQKVQRLEGELNQAIETSNQLRKDLIEAYKKVLALSHNGEKQKIHLSWFAHRDPDIKLLAMDHLLDILGDGKKQVPELIDAAKNLIGDLTSPQVRAKAASFFGQSNKSDDDAERLLKQLDSPEPDADTRVALIKALGRVKNPIAVSSLIKALADPVPDVGNAAIAALGILGKKGEPTAQDVKPKVKDIHDFYAAIPDKDVERRRAFLIAMADIGDPAFAPYFNAAITATEPRLREWGLRGLAGYGNPASLAVMIQHLTHKDAAPSIREAAAWGIGELGTDLTAISPLLDRYLDTNETVGVQSESWTSIKKILGKGMLDWPAQLAFAEERLHSAKPAQYVELVTPIEEKLTTLPAEGETPDQSAKVRERLADALVATNQHAKAEILLNKAHDHFVTKDEMHAAALARKRVASLLTLDQMKLAMEFAGQVTGNPDPKTAPPMAEKILQFITQWLEAKQPERVIKLHVHLAEHLYPKLDARSKAKFDAALAAAQTAWIKANLSALAKQDEAGKQAADEIRAMGMAAVRPLAGELHTLVTADPPNPALEQSVQALLKVLKTDWPGYDLSAKPDVKQAAIKPLLGT